MKKLTIAIPFLIFNKRDNLSSDIYSALAFINDNTPEDVVFVAEIIQLDTATEFDCVTRAGKRCCMLATCNVQNMGYEPRLPKFCIGYYLLWKLVSGDKECVAAETSWPMAGLNRRSTASAPYNVYYWDYIRWGENITWGTSVIIHEIFFVLSLTLADKGYYDLSYSAASHKYGTTLPFIDSWTSFGYQTDSGEWGKWCYKQLTYDMCQKLHEIASTEPPPPIPLPSHCEVNVITEGYKITFDGITYRTPKIVSLPVTEEREYGKPPIYVGQKSIIFERGGARCDAIIKVIRELPEAWALDEHLIPMCLENLGLKYTGTKESLTISFKEEVEEKAARFVIWRDPDTGSETTEVHPNILVVPSEKTPVAMAIANVEDKPLKVDVWADFGSVRIPPQTTPIINPNEELVFDYIFTVPDLPPGSYPTTFYIGEYDKHVYDTFTQPVIKVVKKIVEADFLEFEPAKVVYRGRKARCNIVLDVKNIIRGDSEVADIWTVRDTDTITNAIVGEGITIVDDRVWPIMKEHLVGLTKTPRLITGTQYPLTHEFKIPSDAPLGRSSFETYFGKWGEYFLLGDIFSGHSFDVDVQESSFIAWISEGITFDDVIAIVESYLGRLELGFKPTLDNLIDVVRYYRKR